MPRSAVEDELRAACRKHWASRVIQRGVRRQYTLRNEAYPKRIVKRPVRGPEGAVLKQSSLGCGTAHGRSSGQLFGLTILEGRPGAGPARPIRSASLSRRSGPPANAGRAASVHSAASHLRIWPSTCAFFNKRFWGVVQMYTLGYLQCTFCRIAFEHEDVYLRFCQSKIFGGWQNVHLAGRSARTSPLGRGPTARDSAGDQSRDHEVPWGASRAIYQYAPQDAS